MKRLGLVLAVLMMFSTPVFAQYGGGVDVGRTILHKDARTPEWVDSWFATNNAAVTVDALELRGYNKVRADYDVSGTDVSVKVNFQVSNDTLWVSGDSITITSDSWDVFDLVGAKDYNFYIESITPGDTITIYLTPFNDKN